MKHCAASYVVGQAGLTWSISDCLCNTWKYIAAFFWICLFVLIAAHLVQTFVLVYFKSGLRIILKESIGVYAEVMRAMKEELVRASGEAPGTILN